LKLLLDHCIPRRFARLLAEHEVIHTSRLGWGGLKNGKLLDAAEAADFEVMITVDSSIRFQQNLTERAIGIIVLHAPANDALTLAPMAQMVLSQLESLQPSQVVVLKHPDMR